MPDGDSVLRYLPTEYKHAVFSLVLFVSFVPLFN